MRIGVANNFKADQEVKITFENAVEAIRGLGYPVHQVAAPFADPSKGIANIQADRQAITSQAFKDIDVIVLPATTTIVPMIKDVNTDPQALSPENTAFANYYGLPAISIPCGFGANGLPLGLQVVGKPWGESAVLEVSYRYQAVTDYSEKHP